MIKFRCKDCDQKISSPEVHAGKKGKCPKCKSLIIVPKIKNANTVKKQRDLLTNNKPENLFVCSITPT